MPSEHRITITMDDADHEIAAQNIRHDLAAGIFGWLGRIRVEIRGNAPEPVDLVGAEEFLAPRSVIGMG